MTTIASIFTGVRAGAPQIGEPNIYRYMETFEKLAIGRTKWHGQVNIAKDFGGPWVVTIYLNSPYYNMDTKQNRVKTTSYQHRSANVADAIAEVERLTVEWAQAVARA